MATQDEHLSTWVMESNSLLEENTLLNHIVFTFSSLTSYFYNLKFNTSKEGISEKFYFYYELKKDMN